MRIDSLSRGPGTIDERTPSKDQVRNENIRIAERLKARDPRILDELILGYEQRLRRYLIRLTADLELSQDLLQETWIRVLARGSQFKGDSQFGTWLYAIARNLFFDLQRRRPWPRSLEAITEEREERPFELAGKEKTPFDCFAQIERARILAEALRTLTPRYREVVELRFYREMSLDEIAQVTGACLPTVKCRLYRAVAMLRRHLTAAEPVQSRPLPLAS